jgi:hypothetical protein
VRDVLVSGGELGRTLDSRILNYMTGMMPLTVSEIAATVVPEGCRRKAAALVLAALRRLAAAGKVQALESMGGADCPLEWVARG